MHHNLEQRDPRSKNNTRGQLEFCFALQILSFNFFITCSVQLTKPQTTQQNVYVQNKTVKLLN